VGAPTITARTAQARAGGIRLPEPAGLRIKVSAPVTAPSFPGSLWLWYRSSYGAELGRIRVSPRAEPDVYLLGDGLTARDREGELVLEQDDWCRVWLSAGFALTVLVLADLPRADWGDTVPAPGIADPSGANLSLSSSGGAGRITFP